MSEINQNNWNQHPNQVWSFQNMKDLFSTKTLSKSNDPSSFDTKLNQDIENFEFDTLEGKSISIKDSFSETHADAFLVIKNEEIIYEKYFNEMSAQSPHLMNSISKSFLGMLAGVLVGKGIVDPEDKISNLIPEFKDSAFAETTLQNALDMAGAVKFGEDYAQPDADFWHETAMVGWRPDLKENLKANSLKEFAQSLKDTEQIDGEKYHYRTVLTDVAAMALEQAANKSIFELMDEHIWQKLNPENDAHVVTDPGGFPYFGAGMNASARDLGRFGLMLLNSGKYAEEQIVPASWISDTIAGDSGYKQRFAASEHGPMMPDGHYKNKMWVVDENIMLCIGIHGQFICINKATNSVIVRFSSQPEPLDLMMFANTLAGIQSVSSKI